MNPIWIDIAVRAGISLSADQDALLTRYLQLLLEANQKMNLTRIVDPAAAELQHVGDALTLLPHLPKGSCRIADVGSGGGVPGIPLAIARPDAAITLVESTKKKALFLRETAAALGLSNVIVLDERVEDVALGRQRESFDVAIARAVGSMIWLAEWCLPLVKKGGKMLAMKGEKVAEDLAGTTKTIRMLGGGKAVVHPVILPGTDHRVIVEIPKIAITDRRFPRPASAAKGKPLRL
jgi:16S rRNA (guanine527-N7)-methyltransferase